MRPHEKTDRNDELRARHLAGESQTSLARAFNISRFRVYSLLHRSTTPCKCGCGQYPEYNRVYVAGHKKAKPIVRKHPTCRCGCGAVNPKFKQYLEGHKK